jgi:NMT1-like family
MGQLGWRKVSLPKSRFPRLPRDIDTLDFSGWPIYANASLPEQAAYDICGALAAREAEIPWEKETGGTALHMGRESDSTPMDVPLHPGAERWYREHGQKGLGPLPEGTTPTTSKKILINGVANFDAHFARQMSAEGSMLSKSMRKGIVESEFGTNESRQIAF